MCGICGILGDLDPDQAGATVKRMADSMRHRGPDDEGFHLDPPAYLGHRRLSIIDLSGGHQPLPNEDRSIWTVFNGEIYNHESIRATLEKKGHVYRTHSDSESIVHLYEEDGPAFPAKMNGMFAIALWDRPRRTLVLVRDRLGIKPLYYAQLERGGLAFASEIKALLRCPGVDTAIDPVALDSYLALQYIPGPRTIYRGVQKLPAGHVLVARDNGMTVSPYWTLAARPTPASFEQAAEEFVALFDDAVRIRLMSEVPLGAFLSGGLDSALVVAAMAKAMNRPVRTFSIGFETEGWHSELPYAAEVAARFGTDHETRIVTALDMRTLLATTTAQMDEPLADVAAVPTYLLSAFARDHVTVALTGEGADELFAGYDHYKVEWIMNRLAWMPVELRRAVGAIAGPFAGLRMRKALDAMGMDQAARFVFMRSVLPEHLRRELLRADVARQVPALHLEQRMGGHFPARENGLNAVLRADTLEWLPDDLLMKVDKMSMLASLEARVPFLDYRLVELVSGFLPEWKYRKGRSKVLLKAVAERTLPAGIVHRPKHGFMPPVGSWIRGSLRSFVEEHLLDPAALSAQWLEPQATRRLLQRHLNGEERLALPIWVLLCLEVWLRTGRGSGAPS